MTRPTKDRLEEIRKFIKEEEPSYFTHGKELLAEIDALEAKYNERYQAMLRREEYHLEIRNKCNALEKDLLEDRRNFALMWKERDQLRERVDKLREAIKLTPHVAFWSPSFRTIREALAADDELESDK